MARGLAGLMPALLLLGTALSDEANRSTEEDACLASELGLLLQDRAPGCLRACPSLCPRVVQDVAEALRGGRALRALCAHRAALACATGPRGAEACAPALALAHLPSDLQELCPGLDGGGAASRPRQDEEDRAAEFAAGALARQGGAGRAQPLESSVGGKQEYPLCLGAPEGQTCVPGSGGAPSGSMVYCTAGKYKLWGPVPCSPKYGQDSRCVENGIGLQVAQCDDPFCRNGGAFHGDGLYCHGGKVVRCFGEDAPIVEDDCADFRDQVWENCYKVTERHCVSHSGRNPRCEMGSSSWFDGSDCWRV